MEQRLQKKINSNNKLSSKRFLCVDIDTNTKINKDIIRSKELKSVQHFCYK